jgi:hypothetical protein
MIGGEAMELVLESFLPKTIRVRLISTEATCRIDTMHGVTLAYDIEYKIPVPFIYGTMFFEGMKIKFESEAINTPMTISGPHMNYHLNSNDVFSLDVVVQKNA